MSTPKQDAPLKAQQKIGFCHVTAAQASGQQTTISIHSLAARVYMGYLVLMPDQKCKIESLYDTPGQIHDTLYRWNVIEDQVTAMAEFAFLGLDEHLRKGLDNRWGVHWASGETGGKNDIQRVLYQWYMSFWNKEGRY